MQPQNVLTPSGGKQRNNQRERAIYYRTRKNSLSRLFDNAPIAIALVDDQDRIQNINHAFETIFQYRLPEVLRRSINDVIVPAKCQEEASQL